MEIGMIGLGKMGLNLVNNLLAHEIAVTVFDLNSALVDEAEKIGGKGIGSLKEFTRLDSPRIVWSMVPAGAPTDETVKALGNILSAGDIVIDGGNSHYGESIRHYQELKEKGIHFFDVGTSGGMNGARNGGNFMIGGDRETFSMIEPIFKAIAEENGYLYTGEAGSGHYLKMVHNGIEYGMMQAIGEGFDLLEHSPFNYDNQAVAKVWNNGSVIRSWLMELAEEAFVADPHLDQLKGTMYSSGEGKWTVEESLERQVPMPVTTLALQMRYRSLEEDTFTGKVVASLRNGFGGHTVNK
ncbi:phosphogluconate dehydrogenase (NAD(+)-dependent, decarboxylating) [Enterococcus alishanensis]|uniref:Decarboxylating 6-phosphogluconate dehydrogenase n=1 Tax=Enterococcus alishanensis TaxID=1303817 RepID=A0ABS6TFP7_9ENTE|nr:decarboxylating 6-phosphogluconate dehydrogenase [Enterococcus alishanensis]MBV7391665.1 decarboxylating 6-phosphogluconate dehydrogenase [Enterococcus alishanensis]